MSKRLLVTTALIVLILMLTGLFWLDVPLARWLHDSGLAQSPLLIFGLDLLDTASGYKVSYWLAAGICLVGGTTLLVISRKSRRFWTLGQALVSAALVQASTNLLLIVGKNTFGRMRPVQLLESGDWSVMWFAGGGSFPSGHSAFYCGLLIPLAASTSRMWLRVLLLGIAAFVILTRINMEKHFLSDVSASALIAASVALILRFVLQQFSPTATPAAVESTT